MREPLRDWIPRRSGRRTMIVLVLLGCVLADMWVLHVMWLRRYLDGGQLAYGYFEPGSDGPRLVTEGFDARDVDDDMALASDTRLWVSPGKSLVLPIAADCDFTVTTSSEGRAPYLVFGALDPLDPASSGGGNPAQILSRARRLDFKAEGLSLAAWDATLSWGTDGEWLRELATSCASERSPVRVSTLNGILRVAYGECRLELPLDAESISVLALLPGPAALLVEKPAMWKTHYVAAFGVLAIIMGLACAAVASLFAGLGAWLCVGFSIVPVLLIAWSLLAGVLAWLATALVGVLFACAQLVRFVWTSKRSMRVGIVLALAGGVVVLVRFHLDHPSPRVRMTASGDRSNAPARPLPAVLLGYSAVAGGRLRSDRGRLLDHLTRLAHADVDPLSQRAFPAQTFSRIEQCVCHELDDAPAGSLLLFFGGTNDDWYSGIEMSSWPSLWMTIGRLQFLSDSHRWERSAETFDAAAQSSQAVLSVQEGVIRATVDCARARDHQFIFFHDFLVSDLESALSPDRRRMRKARKDAVIAAGGEFVDLFDVLHNAAGVSWFNDIIHPRWDTSALRRRSRGT